MHKLAIMDETARTRHDSAKSSLRWILGFSCGIATQALFAVTVVGLFSFLRFGGQSPGRHWLLVDTVLALQFAVPHSLLLHPRTRQYLQNWVAPEFYGNMFCVATCLSLWLMFEFWKTSDATLWDSGQTGQQVILGGFYGSWMGLLYSISLTGFGYQTGWTQWACWSRGEKVPRRTFSATGAYRLLRHPVYLSFLGLIWFTPTMTLDHAVLTGIWTIYIGVGSVLKDQRLLYYLGDSYAAYMQSVTGYPLVFAGPLAKASTESNRAVDASSITVVMEKPVRVCCRTPGPTQRRSA